MIRAMTATRMAHAKSCIQEPPMGGKLCRPAMFSGVLALLLAAVSAVAAEPVGVVTILEGDVTAIRGLSRFAMSEGARVMANDLVQTGNGAFARVEFGDGTIVDLGPSTRAQLNRPSLRNGDRPALYLLAGWLKLSAGRPGAPAKAAVASPQFDVVGLEGESVERVQAASGAVFAEGGSMRLLDRRGRARTLLALKSGDFLALHSGEAPKISGRPAQEFVANLPREFANRLPSRIERFTAREVPAKPVGTFTYLEVEPWLDSEPGIRRRFVSEWATKADDIAFREQLDAGLSRHPEWERLLHPERFEPQAPNLAGASEPAPADDGSIRSNSDSTPTVLGTNALQGAQAR